MDKNVFCGVTMTLTFDKPNSNQFILESEWRLFSKKFSRGVSDLLYSKEKDRPMLDRWTDNPKT